MSMHIIIIISMSIRHVDERDGQTSEHPHLEKLSTELICASTYPLYNVPLDSTNFRAEFLATSIWAPPQMGTY